MTSPLLALPAPLSQALADKGYDTLTPVQAAVLNPELAGRDLLVSAQTGSGKTVAFGVAMATDILRDGDLLPPPDTPRALVIAPTRELALQVRREFEWLWAKAGAVLASCVGGMDARTERRALERGAHIVVATPGRLRDHIERGGIDLSLVQAVTLDEADEMLDLGFREDLEFILQSLPAERRTLMFSATVSRDIERLARTYQRDAQRVATQDGRQAHADIAYRALIVAPQDSENAIVNLLRYYEARNALVFCKTRAAVNHLTARFLNRGFSVVPLSGELAQEERTRALQAMRDGRARVCVATDVAARGIDLPGLELVIHADLPSNPEALLHRSGRTGRAGNKGVSALIVPLSARRRTERLLAMAKVEAEWGPAPSAADVGARDTERLLADEALTRPEDAGEMAMVTQLTERFTARELAVAVLRFYFAARSAPEDVAPIGADGAKPQRTHTAFERSFWVRLATGRDQRAEPRWLLPMLCRAGNLTKDDIGAIRIFDDYTLVQLQEDCRVRFENAMGTPMHLEQGIAVIPAQAPAEGDPSAPRAPRPYGGGKPDAARPRKPFASKPAHDKPHAEDSHTPAQAARPPRPEHAPRPDSAARPPRKESGESGAKPRSVTPIGKPDARPGPKPAVKSTDRPRMDPKAALNPSARLDAGKGGKPARKTAGKPFAKPASKNSGKPAGKPFAKPGTRPGKPRPFGVNSRPTRPQS